MPSKSLKNVATLYASISHFVASRESQLSGQIQIDCSWHQAAVVGKTYPDGYALFCFKLDVHLRYSTLREETESEGLKDVLTLLQRYFIQHSTQTTWSKDIFMVVPTHPGYAARTNCLRDRFRGCEYLGDILDRTLFGEPKPQADFEDIISLFDSSVFMLMQSDSFLSSAEVVEEIHARVNFQWLLTEKPSRKTVALIHGRDDIEAFQPLYSSANALGIDLIVVDRPRHWLLSSDYHHMYKSFLPIDMTIDENFSKRIATALEAYGSVDGICTVSDRCIVPVANAARMLGLSTEDPFALARSVNKYETRILDDASATAIIVTDKRDLAWQLESSRFAPEYPLIVKPNIGWSSEYVYKVRNETQLREGVERVLNGTPQKVLIEDYIDGPELDVNFVLLDGEILFFELSDDFPSPGDNGSLDCDFWENTNTLPSKLPGEEYKLVRDKLHRLLLDVGLKTGVYHLEARVANSSMEYSEVDGVMDLRSTQTQKSHGSASCHLIEINPRPPGFPCVLGTCASYGVNMFDAHFLSCMQDFERLRGLSKPFEPKIGIPNFARVWSQIVFFKVEKGGICASSRVCEEAIQHLPASGVSITDAVCFFREGQRIPEPKQGVVIFGAFFIVVSKDQRAEVVEASLALQKSFSIPIEPC